MDAPAIHRLEIGCPGRSWSVVADAPQAMAAHGVGSVSIASAKWCCPVKSLQAVSSRVSTVSVRPMSSVDVPLFGSPTGDADVVTVRR